MSLKSNYNQNLRPLVCYKPCLCRNQNCTNFCFYAPAVFPLLVFPHSCIFLSPLHLQFDFGLPRNPIRLHKFARKYWKYLWANMVLCCCTGFGSCGGSCVRSFRLLQCPIAVSAWSIWQEKSNPGAYRNEQPLTSTSWACLLLFTTTHVIVQRRAWCSCSDLFTSCPLRFRSSRLCSWKSGWPWQGFCVFDDLFNSTRTYYNADLVRVSLHIVQQSYRYTVVLSLCSDSLVLTVASFSFSLFAYLVDQVLDCRTN